MKKMTRLLIAVLTVVLLVSSMSVIAFAAVPRYNIHGGVYGDQNSVFGSEHVHAVIPNVPGGVTVAPERQFRVGDDFYDLTGSAVFNNPGEVYYDGIDNGVYERYLPKKYKGYSNVIFAYAPHQHRLSPNAPWHYDENNHWKDCETCPCWLLMNWHHDVDNDGVCDQCHQPIVYRNLSVKNTEGGKVTLSADKGTVGNRVAVTVTADPGYKLVDIRGMNTTAKKYSYRPCIQDVKGSQYHFFIDVYDVEVVAKFVKE